MLHLCSGADAGVFARAEDRAEHVFHLSVCEVSLSQELKCKCGKHMGILRDAKIRNGMVVYCAECNAEMWRKLARADCYIPCDADMPDFLKGIFRR